MLWGSCLFFIPLPYSMVSSPPKKHGWFNHLFNLELKKWRAWITKHYNSHINYQVIPRQLWDLLTRKNEWQVYPQKSSKNWKSVKNHLNHPKSNPTPPPFFWGGVWFFHCPFFKGRPGVSTMKKFNPKELRSCSCTDKSAAWSCGGCTVRHFG